MGLLRLQPAQSLGSLAPQSLFDNPMSMACDATWQASPKPGGAAALSAALRPVAASKARLPAVHRALGGAVVLLGVLFCAAALKGCVTQQVVHGFRCGLDSSQ